MESYFKKDKSDIYIKIKNNLFSIFVTLLGFFGSELFLGEFSGKGTAERIILFLGIFLLVIILEIIAYYLYDYFLYWKDKVNIKDKGIIFPEGITSKDIFRYITDHVEINYKLNYNPETGLLDLDTTERYKISGGINPVEYIDHTFLFSEKDKKSVTIEAIGIEPDDIIAQAYFFQKKVTSIFDYNTIYRVKFAMPLELNSTYQYELKLSQPGWANPYAESDNQLGYFEITPIIEIKKITLSVEFPKDFQIICPKISVIGKSDLALDKVEKNLISQNPGFKQNIISRGRKMTLHIDTPIPDVRYRVNWVWPIKKD